MANKIPLAIADLELQLATAVPVGATFFTLSSATDDDGVALPAGMYCFTLDSGTSNKEYLLGQVNGTAVTSVMSVSRQGVETSGAAREHRVGAPCIVTNFATLQRVADILRGELTLDGANPIAYDTAPTLSDGKELATVQYVLDTTNGGTVNFNARVVTGVNAGETVAAGNLVYFKTSDQEWYKCDADTAATVNGVELGIALGSGTDGAAITGGVLLRGVYTTTGLTAGSAYYASNTAGAISSSAGTTSVQIGVALSTTVLLFNPREFSIPTADEKAAMAGGGDFGTPSSTNKFLTEDSVSSNSLFLPIQIVPFTSSGTWTKDAGLKYIVVEVQAGGGTGGSSWGGGGGAGAYAKKLILATDLGATETVTVGTAGNTSSFTVTGGSTISCTAGGAGTSSGVGGTGGTASNGDINVFGGDGGTGGGTDTGGGGNSNNSGGMGGASFFGSGGKGGADTVSGTAGRVYGSGGGGGGSDGGTGAAGAAGIIIVTEHYS